jgi:hypothetical protein
MNLCNNVILMCYSWAFDKFEQAINRAHRLNSPWPVNVYPIICDGSIDRKLEAMTEEKGDAAELVLDGHLLGEHASEVNLGELLNVARKEFNDIATVDETELEKQWPPLRAELGQLMTQWSGCMVALTQSASDIQTNTPKFKFEQKQPSMKRNLPALWRRRLWGHFDRRKRNRAPEL